MRFAMIVALFSAMALASAADAPRTKPVDAAGWRALTLRDSEAMHALLRDHTMIPFDAEAPAYARWLEAGLVEARTRAATVADQAGYTFTLLGYIAGFHDPHFNLTEFELSVTRWPGFVAASRGGQAVITLRDPGDPSIPALGAIIESCDGAELSQLFRERLGPFFGGSPFSGGAGSPEHHHIPALFLDFRNPFVPLPATCRVRTGDQVAEIRLRWRSISGPSATPAPPVMQEVINAGRGPAAAWGVSEPVPGVFWIGVPTFMSEGGSATKLRAVVDAAKARGGEMRKARAIVIDMRGNSGGLTIWPRQLADAVFTPAVMKAARKGFASQRVAVETRASPGNVMALRKLSESIDGQLTDAQRRQQDSAIEGLERAARDSPPVLRSGSKRVSPAGGITTRRPRGRPSPFRAQVYLLSNGSCMSACLEFADEVLMVPGVRLIGSATAGDSPYGNIRREMLPSGLAGVLLPQHVARGRGRAALEAYQPDVPYSGSWEDARVRAWVLALIESAQ